MEVGDPSYRTVKGILAVGADKQAAAGPVSAASAATPAHLHGPQGLFAHLDGAGGDGVGGDGVGGDGVGGDGVGGDGVGGDEAVGA
jgi:hypothetical protein